VYANAGCNVEVEDKDVLRHIHVVWIEWVFPVNPKWELA